MITYSRDDKKCVLSCKCGCGDSVQLVIEEDDDLYFFQTLLDCAWNYEQRGWLWRFKKIWAILRNKDYHYSEICLNKEEFEEYKEWINRF